MDVSAHPDRNVLETTMESVTLNALARPATGKGAARKARAGGRTPGILYRAGEDATPLAFDVAELATIFRGTNDPNTLIQVEVKDGGSFLCLVREIQRDPVSRTVMHVDFYEVRPEQPVEVDVSVTPVGRAAGTRAGGMLRLLARRLRLKVPAGNIPKTVEVDVSPLEVGQFLKASELPQPAGGKILFKQDFNIVTVEGKRTAKEEAPAEGAAAAAPAAGAAAAAKPAAAKPPAKKA